MTYSSLSDAVTGFKSDADRVDTFGNGEANATYTSKTGAIVPSIQNLIGQWNYSINVAANGILAQSTAQAGIAATQAGNASDSASASAGSAATAQTAATQAQTAIPPVQVVDYAALWAYTGTATKMESTGYLVTSAPSGIAGPFVRDDSDTTSGAYGAGSISGTTLTISAKINGSYAVGQAVRGVNVAPGTFITALGTGTGGTGTYVVNVSQTAASATICADDGGITIVNSQGKRWKRTFSGGIDVRWFGALGDGIADDYAPCNAAISVAGIGGTVLFPKTAANIYNVSAPLKYASGQTWIGSGGVNVVGSGTQIRLTAAGTSVCEPIASASNTFGFNPRGIYFNAQGNAPVGLSLKNTSYASIDQCAANVTQTGAAAILLDSQGGQCYFNKLNQPRVFAIGASSVCIRFSNGANSNQIFGGKYGSSNRGMEFLTLSSGNVIVGADFENNTDRHVYADAPNNIFIGCHMETCPVGYEITANGNGTVRISTSFSTNVTTQVIDASKTGGVLESRTDTSGTIGELAFGSASFKSTYLTGASALSYDPFVATGSSNVFLNLLRNTNTTGTRQLNCYKGDGSATITYRLDLSTGVVTHGDIVQENTVSPGVYRQNLRRAAPPPTGTYTAGDLADNTIPSTSAPVATWGCYAGGSSGSWQATSWFVFKGPTASRPALNASAQGVMYLDTTLAAAGKPIMWTGTQWVDMTGTVV